MTLLTKPSATEVPVGVVTVLVTEALDVSTLQEFWARLKDAAAQRPERLIVDLHECRHLDAQAIRLLLDIHQLIWLQEGRVVLRGVRPPVTRLLALAGVLNVFTREPDIPEQVAG